MQVDLQTGESLHVAYRRSDLIESLHDGSWFHDRAKMWIFLPAAVIVLILWLTGMYLFVLPYSVRFSRWRERVRLRRISQP
jgi:membrane protein YdbS with pleckstrin-like domain